MKVVLKSLVYVLIMFFSATVWAHSHKEHKHEGSATAVKEVVTKNTEATNTQELKGGEQIIVTVNGMVCSFCSTNIEKKLMKNKEVKNVKVDLDQKKVFITLNKGKKLTDTKIKNEIKKSGYKVVSIKRG